MEIINAFLTGLCYFVTLNVFFFLLKNFLLFCRTFLNIFEYILTILCSEFVFCPRHFIQTFTGLYNLKIGF